MQTVADSYVRGTIYDPLPDIATDVMKLWVKPTDPGKGGLPARQMVFGVIDIARWLEIHPQTVRQMIREKALVGMRKVGHCWVIARRDLYRAAMVNGWIQHWPPESPIGGHDAR